MLPERGHLSGQHVLIVDEEADLAERLAAILSRRGGARVRCAASLASARALLEQGLIPTVILLDHKLGDDIGTSLARWIRSQPTMSAVQIVSFSAHPRDVILETCHDQPLFDVILTKGDTSIEELLRQISAVLA
jgi:CheY-like chemotaxis protein